MSSSRIKGYYTATKLGDGPLTTPRWLDPHTGQLYMSEYGPYTALGSAGRQVAPGVWEFKNYTWRAAELPSPCTGPVANGQAYKADDGKPNWFLLMSGKGCAKALAGVVRVLSSAVRSKDKGGKGYTEHSWREVPNAKERYQAALYRHLNKLELGETHDDESGESHWYHVATNALFLAELHNAEEKQ